jgi:hypothetical protein
MTELTKRVRRECMASYRGRTLIVEVSPDAGGTITVREKGRRRGFSLPVLSVFWLAMKAWAAEEAKRRHAERLERRRARRALK